MLADGSTQSTVERDRANQKRTTWGLASAGPARIYSIAHRSRTDDIMTSENLSDLRRAAIVLETLAEDLYVRACLTDKRNRNRLMERRAKMIRISREMLDVVGLIGTKSP